MHIKRLLSGSLAAMMVATSFNVPINVKAAEVPDTEPAAGLEENQELPSSDAEIPVDDDTNVVVEEPAVEPEVEVVTPVEEATEETPAEELVVEEETAEQEVVGETSAKLTLHFEGNGATLDTTKFADVVGEVASADNETVTPTATIPNEDPVREGYVFKGWKLTKKGEASVDDGAVFNKGAEVIADAITEDVTYTLTAQWTADITETKVDISTLDIEFESAVYTGKNITPVIKSVKKGGQTFDISDFKFKVYDTAEKAETAAEGTDALPKNAGKYYVVVTSDQTKYQGSDSNPTKKTVEFTVDKYELKDTDITLVKEEGVSAVEGQYHITYSYDNGNEKIQAPEPTVTITGLEDDTFEFGTDYEVEYSGNSVAGKTATATATVTLKNTVTNYTTAEGGIKKTFEVIEDTKVASTDIKKAGFNYDGTIKTVLKSGRETSETIPAITRWTIPTAVIKDGNNLKKEDFENAINLYYSDNAKVEKGKDANDKIYWTVEWPETVADDAKEIEYKLVLNGTHYGKYGEGIEDNRAERVTEISGKAKIVNKSEKEYTATDYNILVVDSPATFANDGCLHYVNELGEVATNKTGDILTEGSTDGDGSPISYKINQLNAELEQEEGSDSSNEYTYTGEDITPAVTIKTTGFVDDKTFDDISFVYKKEEHKVGLPVRVDYEDYIDPGTAKAIITVKDSDGLYSGSKTIEYNIITKDEEISKPELVGEPYDEYSYGTKVRFKTATEGADIYYTYTESLNGADPGNPSTASHKYEGPITLTEEMAVTDAVTSKKIVKINLIAIKKVGDKELKSEVYNPTFTMKEAKDDWGGVVDADKEQWKYDASKVSKGLWVGEASLGQMIYNGKPQTFTDLRVYYHKKLLTIKEDYTIKYSNNTNAWVQGDSQYVASKQPSFTVTGKGKYSGTFTRKFGINPLVLTEADATGYGNATIICVEQYLSNAKPVKATGVKLYQTKWEGEILKYEKVIAPSNYTLEYYNSYNPSDPSEGSVTPLTSAPGQKYVVATMQGNYRGEIVKPYQVVDSSKALSKNTNISLKTNIKWDESGVNPQLVITDKATKARLIQGTDYEVHVTYYGNGKSYGQAPQSGENYRYKGYTDSETINLTSVGTYFLNIYGKGKYDGTVSKTINVTGTKLSIADFKVADNKFTGSEIKPTYKVKAGKEEVINTETIKKYDATLRDNKNPGTAILEVVGNNDYGFVATPVTKTFKIIGTALIAKNVTYKPEIPFDGEAPLVTDYELSVKVGNTTLNASTDYEAKLYDSYTSAAKFKAITANAGKKVLVVSGKDEKGYTGTVKINVKVTPVKLTDTTRIKSVTVADADLYKSGAIPVVTVKDEGIGNQELILGRDYTIKVSNNTVVANKDAKKKAPTVTITGKGNYTGTLNEKFNIKPGNLAKGSITAVDQTAGKFAPAKTKVVVTLGKALAVGEKKDYTVKYFFNAGTQGVKYTVDKEEKTAYGNAVEVKPNYELEPGTEINVVATGTGTNYTGNISTTIRVAKAGFDISKASFAIADQTYTGSEILVGSENFTKSTLGKTALEYGTDYIIDEGSYVANTNVGTAKVTVKGIGDYAGSKVVSFKIKAKSMLYNLAFEAVDQNFGTNDAPEKLCPTGTTKTLTSKDGTFKLPAPTFKDVDSKKYVFVGWYTEPEFNNFVGIKGDTCSFSDKINAGETYTLYAKYEKVGSYVITFDKNRPNAAPTGFEVTGTMKNQTIKRGALTALTNNAYKLNGYTFKGWSYTSNGTVVYNNKQKVYNAFSAGETPNKLYAVWEPIEYKVTFKDGGRRYNYSTLSYSTDYGSNTIDIPEKDGYEFISWKVSNSKVELREVKDENDERVVGYVIPVGTTGNLTLTGTWKATDFKVKFDNNAAVFDGALGTVTGTMPELQFKSDVGQKLPANTFKVTGDYTFAGWSNHAAINNHVVTKDKASVKLASSVDITMYAVWRENTYAIKYSGATVTTAAPRSYTLAAGSATVKEALSATTPDVKKGYTFSGWSTDGRTVTASTDAAEIAKLVKTKLPITLKAVWTKETAPVAKTITYKFAKSAATGAEPGNETVSDIVLEAGKTATYPECPWKWDGHTFKGWISTADHAAVGTVAEDKIHAEGSTLTAPATIESSSVTTMYAYWVVEDTPSVTKHTITFAPGTYGNDATPTGTMAPVEADAGEYTLPESGYTASGYNFAGWKIGNSDDVKSAGDKITINGNVTITATWTPDTPIITYYLDGGRWAESYSAPATYTVGNTAATTLPVEANISKDADDVNTYAFEGWVVVSDESDDVSSKTTITEIPTNSTSALKLKAKWTPTAKP